MAKIIKFIYLIITILSLSFAATNVESLHSNRHCFRDSDCIKDNCRRPTISKCLNRLCKCVAVFQRLSRFR
ncbi:unnamed protein product [Lathyrus oleraceus]